MKTTKTGMKRMLLAFAAAGAITASTALSAVAQPLVIPNVAYPKLPAHGLVAADFEVPGWRVEEQSTGDLNGDGVPDLVVVLREHNPRNVLDNSGGLGPNSLDTNPRILLVALGRSGGAYELVAANHVLIPRQTEPTFDDFLSEDGGVAIKHGTLKVTLHLFASAGGWGMGSTTYSFRVKDSRVELVGCDNRTVQRNTGEVDVVSVDYLSDRMKTSTGRTDSSAEKVVWTTLPARPLMTLGQVGDGMDFDPAHPPR